jgi:hypothetical protein
MVLPLHAAAWRDALDQAVRQRDELVAAGHHRAAQFTAEASGRALAAVYERALS